MDTVVEPSFKLIEHSSILETLQDGEFVSAFDSCAQYMVAGTSRGSVLIFDLDGSFIVGDRALIDGAVTALRVSSCVVAVGSSSGGLALYNWLTNAQCTLGDPLGADSPITALAAGPGLAMNHGAVYYGTSTGTVARRGRGKFYGFSDQVLYANVSADAPVLEAIWFGVGAPASSGGSAPSRSAIDAIQVMHPHVVFSWSDAVIVYDEVRDVIVGRFSSRTGTVPAPRTPAGHAGSGDPRGGAMHGPPGSSRNSSTVTILPSSSLPSSSSSPADGTSRAPSSSGPGSLSAAGQEPHVAVPPALTLPRAEDAARFHVDGQRLLIAFGRVLHVCSRDFARDGLCVVRRVDLGHPIRAVCAAGDKVVAALSTSRAERERRDPRDGTLTIVTVDRTLHLVVLDAGTLAPCGAAIEVVVYGGPGVAVRGNGGSVLGPLLHLSPPLSRGPENTAVKNLLPSFTEDSFPFDPRRCVHMAFPCAVVSLRPPTLPESVLFRVRSHDHLGAIRLCKAARKQDVLMEVADVYAERLWAAGDRAVAVQIWAEYILPVAPREYWTSFVERLGAAGETLLLERYLPFNDRRLLPGSVYLNILLHYLDSGDYRGLHARVSRWPVYYDAAEMISRIDGIVARALAELAGAAESSGDLDGLRMRLLDETPIVAREPGRSTDPDIMYTPASTSYKDRGYSSSSLILSGSGGRGGKGQGDGDDGDWTSNPSDLRHLFLSLFKLHEFRSDHVAALRVLVRIGDASTMEYLEAHSLWTYFSMSYMVNDVLRKALGTQFDVLGDGGGDGSGSGSGIGVGGSGGDFGDDPSSVSDRDRSSRGGPDSGQDDDDESETPNDSDEEDTEASVRRRETDTEELVERQQLLRGLLRLDPRRTLQMLVQRHADIPTTDAVRLLRPVPAFRLAYLESLTSARLTLTASHHDDMLHMYAQFLAPGGKCERWGAVPHSGPSIDPARDEDTVMTLSVDKRSIAEKAAELVRNSSSIDFSAARNACASAKVNVIVKAIDSKTP